MEITSNHVEHSLVFVNVGAGERTGIRCLYDGNEDIVGGHEYLAEHGDNCAEMAMFARRDDGYFHSHAGPNAIRPRDLPLDAVFVARDPEATGPKKHVVLGMYVNPNYELERGFARFTTDRAIVIPPEQRGELRLRWPGRVRMWARRDRTNRYPEMIALYARLRELG